MKGGQCIVIQNLRFLIFLPLIVVVASPFLVVFADKDRLDNTNNNHNIDSTSATTNQPTNKQKQTNKTNEQTDNNNNNNNKSNSINNNNHLYLLVFFCFLWERGSPLPPLPPSCGRGVPPSHPSPLLSFFVIIFLSAGCVVNDCSFH